MDKCKVCGYKPRMMAWFGVGEGLTPPPLVELFGEPVCRICLWFFERHCPVLVTRGLRG